MINSPPACKHHHHPPPFHNRIILKVNLSAFGDLLGKIMKENLCWDILWTSSPVISSIFLIFSLWCIAFLILIRIILTSAAFSTSCKYYWPQMTILLMPAILSQMRWQSARHKETNIASDQVNIILISKLKQAIGCSFCNIYFFIVVIY